MTHITDHERQRLFPLYDPRFEHDACGVGFVAQIKGMRSHSILTQALKCVCNLTHRGAVDADTETGDGAGILTQIPVKLFLAENPSLANALHFETDLGVGMLFMPHTNDHGFAQARSIVESVVAKREIGLLGWRIVPTDASVLGDKAAATQPNIRQILLSKPVHLTPDQYERTLYIIRREIEKEIHEAGIKPFYIASLSSRIVVYKGLMIPTVLDRFFLDLANPLYETALAIYHQRFSTNTFPRWELAHPFRMLAHNGEINTIQGNRIWTKAREAEISSPLWRDDIEYLKPIIQAGGSDSMHIDNVLELLTVSGRPLLHSMMMLVPETWASSYHADPAVRAFYEFHECLNEPWDGPAALVFSDGITVAAALDRNGLRPLRYKITDDDVIILGSEVGPVLLDDANVVKKGRLGPGQMLAVDTQEGVLLKDLVIKRKIASRKPYAEWIKSSLYQPTPPDPVTEQIKPPIAPEDLRRLQRCAGYSSEELTSIYKPMIQHGLEPMYSMGDDTPLAILSRQSKPLSAYFKQQFAQVTNPPIDPLRERLVMSLGGMLGRRRNWLDESPEHAQQVLIPGPFLFDAELSLLRCLVDPLFQATTLSTLYPAAGGAEAGLARLEALCLEAEHAADEGKYLVVLCDRGVDAEHAALPILLATGAVHNHLMRVQKRLRLSVVTETSEPRDVHEFATLIGYGVNAINPYLALETIRSIVAAQEAVLGVSVEEAFMNYRRAIEKGILKIIAKMGISLLGSYRGAQIFEAVGISQKTVDRYFTGTPTRIGGLSTIDIINEALTRHSAAFTNTATPLPDLGLYRYRKFGEQHAWAPAALRTMQQFRKSGSDVDYQAFATAIDSADPIALKDLLAFRSTRPAVPLDDVEPVEDILKRCTTAAMSLGSIAPEVHETIAIAMNRIGGKSNTGEGGEAAERFHLRPNGDSANSAIKQVASARFGVTAEYLVNAKEIEIKMAQGSKPGEGGQLPGSKVTPLIAQLRRSAPGVQLISPPPHHDIYSIEDLAQLIYDLKQVNPRARIGVKLVAEAGVGTIAAGVAKAQADIIIISGHNGGTGASPLSSIANAGGAWELGLAEAQQVLVLNGLRERVTIRVDGGLKTARDIVIAAMLGAEEFNFGTAALIALGCRMARQCHLNTCPVGIATQDETLRKNFEGTPEMLVNYLTALANDIRQILAQLGYTSLNDVIGRSDLLRQHLPENNPKAQTIDLSAIISPRDTRNEQRHRIWQRNDKPDKPLDDIIIQDVRDAINEKIPVVRHYRIRNTNRAVGTQLSGVIAYQYGDRGLPEKTIDLRFRGSAGQSFGAFLVHGVRLTLVGEANDYVGKGMSGGEIIIYPAHGHGVAAEDIIVGNTVLFGATGGLLFASGRAAERFAVRNSGALAVVEGVGDHACEYMTNGQVFVLGMTGKNFGAGMTGGKAYVFDTDGSFSKRYNPETVRIHRVTEESDVVHIQSHVSYHLELTDSQRAREILNGWSDYRYLFWKVVPKTAPGP